MNMARLIRFGAACLALIASSALPGEAALLPGMGELSGKVTGPKSVALAKVYAKNTDKNIGYAVFVSGGNFRAVDLFPGHYEVTITKNGFAPQTAQVDVRAGALAKIDFALQDAPLRETYIGGATYADHKIATYDAIYPPGPGRDVIERTCMVCHGVNFLPGLAQPREAWAAAIDYMTTGNAFGSQDAASMFDPVRLPPADRETVLDYLENNMGPEATLRVVKDEGGVQLNEAELGKAMIVEYLFPNTAAMPHRWTQEVHFDKNGIVYVTERGTPPSIVRLDPQTGEHRDFLTPDAKSSPHGLTVDADGTVWWAGRNVFLAHLDPVTGNTDQYAVTKRGLHGHTPVFTSKGDLWFSELPGNKIGNWDRKTDKITIFDSPEPRARPYGLIVDHNDLVWYVEYHGDAVVRFDPATKEFKRFLIKSRPASMRRLGVDSKGFIWYGVYGTVGKAGKIGRLDPATGDMVERALPIPYSNPYDAWADDADNIWISTDNYLVMFNQKTEAFTLYPMPERTDQPKMSITRDGAIWYTPRHAGLTGGYGGGAAVLYPDKDKIKTLGAFYSTKNSANHVAKYKGPTTPVRNLIKSSAAGGQDVPGPPPKAEPTDRTPIVAKPADGAGGGPLAD